MIKKIFFACIVKPFILFAMGLHIKGKEYIKYDGACIVAANHNSHLDTLIIMSLFPIHIIEKVRPIAAADYFFRNSFLKWFAINIIGIIPIERTIKASSTHPLQGAIDALNSGEIVIIFPEGSRGEAEKMSSFKSGVAHLAKILPNTPVIPISIFGAGKSLPKGEALFVPFIADISINKAIIYQNDESGADFTKRLAQSIENMQSQNKGLL